VGASLCDNIIEIGEHGANFGGGGAGYHIHAPHSGRKLDVGAPGVANETATFTNNGKMPLASN